MTRYSIILFLTLFITATSGQVNENYETAVKTEDLLKDFMIFRDSLEKVHPALYRYSSKNEMNKLLDSCYLSINEGMTTVHFFMTLRFLTRAIGDGHTACNLPRELIVEQFQNSKVFPLRLYFTKDQTFVFCDFEKRFKQGTEITAIDEKPVNEIRKVLFNYMLSDGSIESSKYWSFNGSEPNFQFLYYWLYGNKPQFSISYKGKDGLTETAVLNASILKGNSCFNDKKSIENFLSLEIKANSTAILTIKTFDMNRLNQEDIYFKNFLDSVFMEINAKKIKKLIIDVRNNGGGEDSNGSLLYSFLTNKPFAYYSSLGTVSSKFPEDAHPNLKIQQPQKNNFMGKCYFLINGKSFSTTSEFCAIAKSNARGKFIGEETGGGYYGNTGGELEKVTLPITKITVVIPRRKYVLAVRQQKFKDRGVIPDYEVIPSINDILSNKDVQLEYTLKLTEKE
ncbi:MAG: hypothetical protein KIT62_01795 [Cyclobacteriaceae bacterium]|nr:hypothetical protein [Cyclobacteriaceae bacterium]